MKALIPCQCADRECGFTPCPRSATAEDLKCDYCRTALELNALVDLNYPSAIDMIIT